MPDQLSQFLKSHGARRLRAASLRRYASEMTGKVIPAITRDVQAREQLAAEMRYVTPNAARKTKQDGD